MGEFDRPTVTNGEDLYRVMVPLANPEHEHELIELASAIVKHRGGVVDAIHIVTVPDQTSLEHAAERFEELNAESAEILHTAREDAETFGVDIELHTVLSHRGFDQIFDSARSHGADLVVMGWGEHGHARAEPVLEELSGPPPCDFLVLRDRGFDPERILVPTAGGSDSALSAEIADVLAQEYGSDLTLLHVTDDTAEGEAFLQRWADDHELQDAAHRVETGDVDEAIARVARDATMVIIGATERGLLARLVNESPIVDVIEEVECSVLMAERPAKRSLRQRLFGVGTGRKT